MRCQLLGPVDVHVASGSALGLGPRPRAVLACLLLSPDRSVSPDRLVADVWPEGQTPRRPTRALQVAVSRLRTAVDDPDWITWDGHGYLVHVAGHEVDLWEFERLRADGRRLVEEGDPGSARQPFSDALELWKGPALGGIGDAPLARTEAPRLEELRLAVTAERIDACLASGQHIEVVSELRQLVERHPLHERFHGQLMLALYRSGQQAAALEAYRACRAVLAAQVGADPDRRLQRLHTAILNHDSAVDGPTTSIAAATSVPPSLTSYVGREEDTSTVEALLAEHRLVTITGTGGSGKTRLAREVARRQGLDRHPGGVWLVDLAPLEEGRHVAFTVARTLGVEPSSDGRSADEVLARALGRRRVLVVLDNCEHVLSGAGAVVQRLLLLCPGVRVLATSREPLAVPGEHRWSLRGLPVPPPQHRPAPRMLHEVASVRLFLDRAAAADPSFEPDDRDLDAVARICRQVAGLPLAIELAAPWVRLLSCEEIAAQLDPSGPVLAAATTTPEQRHRSLSAALDWSHDRLDDAERTLLLRLSVFRGPMTLAAIEHVVQNSGWRGQDVLVHLQRLVDTSLVEAQPRDPNGPSFRLLEPVRQHAIGRLAGRADEAAVRSAHADWCRVVWRETADVLRRHEDALAIHPLVHVWHDDLRAALHWCMDTGRGETALRLAGAAYLYWWTYGRLTEGLRWLHSVLEQTATVDPRLRAPVLAGAAFLELHVDADITAERTRCAVTHATRAVDGAAAHPDEEATPEHALALIALAHGNARPDGDLAAASRLVAAGRTRAADLDDLWTINYARVVEGAIAYHRGRLDDAVAAQRELLEASEAAGAMTGMIAAHFNLAHLAMEREQYRDARHHLETVVLLKRRSGTDPFGSNHSNIEEWTLLTHVSDKLGDTAASRRYAQKVRDANGEHDASSPA